MRSSVKKCPTIVCRRGVWRGLELSIKSLPLRRNEPEDENLPVFLCLYPTGASLLANRRDKHKKRCAASTPVHFCKGPSGKERGNAEPVRASPILRGERGRECRPQEGPIPVLLGMGGAPIPPPVGSIILPSQDDGTPNPIQIPF